MKVVGSHGRLNTTEQTWSHHDDNLSAMPLRQLYIHINIDILCSFHSLTIELTVGFMAKPSQNGSKKGVIYK